MLSDWISCRLVASILCASLCLRKKWQLLLRLWSLDFMKLWMLDVFPRFCLDWTKIQHKQYQVYESLWFHCRLRVFPLNSFYLFLVYHILWELWKFTCYDIFGKTFSVWRTAILENSQHYLISVSKLELMDFWNLIGVFCFEYDLFLSYALI